MADPAEIGALAAGLMESIDEVGGEVGAIAIIVEVERPPGEIDGDEEMGSTEIIYRCNDGRMWIQAGLLHRALLIAESS